eukprot:gene2859-3123_t
MSTTETKGPSKKELNKLARKEKKSQPTSAEAVSDGPVEFTVHVPRGAGPKPDVTRAVELLLGSKAPKIRYVIATATTQALPHMTSELAENAGAVSGDVNIAKFLLRKTSSVLYDQQNAWIVSQVDQWLEVYSYTTLSTSYLSTLPDLLESFLATKSFLAGHLLTLADIAVYLAIKRLDKSVVLGVNLQRWVDVVASHLPALTPAPVTFVPAKKEKAPVVEKKEEVEKEEEGGTCPALENAVEGQVCTRFPPEPSGYLHIGHAKAVLLNQYYAQRYKGKLIVRFDDTNPSKEKEEFEENIIQDLATLGVHPDFVSHSSDYFAKCEELARQMIREGKAYMDDTDQETMQAERLERKESKHRNDPPEVGLAWFEKLLAGEKDAQVFCMRAKIDMNSVNGTMRDPVLYRYNATPHHRTGTKFKAYPTYDFVCPIIDAIEGVTHALRTTEYNDRDEQYHWIQEALGLRYVYIQTFGKMNFVNTVLSKRKLTWFVEQGLVEGWFDPRFPTIQGCIRRGMNIHALKNFIISQGASRRVITMEWDKFWAENKKVLEESCPRYMGISPLDVAVPLTLENVPDEITFHTVQIHPQKAELGTRVMRRGRVVLIDQIDAVTYSVGEEITLLRWGNVKLSAIEKDSSGKVISMKGEYDANATNFSKTKKVTWLTQSPDLVPARLLEFDHIISKAKLGEDEDFKNFVNPVSKFEVQGVVDACLRNAQAGDVIQLERKGFYRVDKPYNGSDQPIVLFYIPDGKAKPTVTSGAKSK